MALLVTSMDSKHEFIAQVSLRFKFSPGCGKPYTDWLNSLDAKGFYTRAFRDLGDSEYTDLTVYFTDADTAFAFKMRFG